MRQSARSFARALPALGRAVALVLVLPFVLLSLMAQGTMVARGAAPQSFMVALCADHMPVEMVLDADGTVVRADEYRAEQSEQVPKSPKSPCDWSVHAQPMLETVPVLPVVAAQLSHPADPAAARDQRVLRAEVLAALARGPPAA